VCHLIVFCPTYAPRVVCSCLALGYMLPLLQPLGVTVARRCRRAAWTVVVAANGRAGGGRRDARARVGNTVRKVPRERSTDHGTAEWNAGSGRLRACGC